MAETIFGLGDVVKLKSGGPRMTVEYMHVGTTRNHATCVWFDENDHVVRTILHEEALKIAE